MSRDLLYPRRVRWSEQELRHLADPPPPTTANHLQPVSPSTTREVREATAGAGYASLRQDWLVWA